MPTNSNCWDDFQFDDNSCSYTNLGIEPVTPTNINCWDDFQLDANSCSYFNQGLEPPVPVAVNSWDLFQLDPSTCTYLNVGMEPPSVYISNIFCPDCGINNTFFVQGRDSNISIIKSLIIYNRWGSMLYSITDIPPNEPDLGWDGTFNGSIVDPGVYVYVAEIEFNSGVVDFYSGDITLIK